MNTAGTVYDLVIKGNVVLPDQVLYDASLAVINGKIAGVFSQSETVTGKEFIDATGQYILPGAIDAHVHCYSSLAEGFTKASQAAAAGGVTTIIEMPYDASGMICTEEALYEKLNRLQSESIVDVAMLATIKKEGGLEEIPRLAKAGVCGFKVSMFNTDPVRFPRIDDGHLLEAFSLIAETGCPVGVHAEVDEIVRRSITKFRDMGTKDPRAHCWSRPKVSESAAALTVMELAYWTGAKAHLYHTTVPRIFEFVEYYRSQGAHITAETCTHYLTLHEEDMLRLHAKGKINPPLRSVEDVKQLWNLVARGSVDIITSDHAPWTIDKKSHEDIFQNASGAPGVETLLPMIYSEGVAQAKITILDMVRLLSENPASIFGLDYCKGKIAQGMDADLVILDPNQSYILREENLHSSAGWSPYHGWHVQGKIVSTFVRGKRVFGEGIMGLPGFGRFVPAQHHSP
jgi:allantoinase